MGGRGGLGPGDEGRGPGLLPLAAGGGPTHPGPLASPGRCHRGAARRRFGQGLRAVGSCPQRDRAARLLRLPPRRGHWPDPEPIPPRPGPGQGPGARAPEPHGAPPQRAHGPLPADGPRPDPPQRPRHRVQRDLRPARIAPGPGAGRLLRLHRGPGLRAVVGHPGWRGPRAPAHQRGPQGQPSHSGTPRVHRRLRVVAALPAGDGRSDPARTPPALVVDASWAGSSAHLPRRPSDVRAGQHPGRHRDHAALLTPHRRLPDGRGPGASAHRCPACTGARPADHHPDLPDPRKEDVIRRVLAHHAEQTARAAERAVAIPAPGYAPETLDVLFGAGS